MKVYGYCRTSTVKQNIERQVRNILAYNPNATLFEESFSGTTDERPMFTKLMRQALRERLDGENVTIVFDSVSRMSRSAAQGYHTYKLLYDEGVHLVFLKEPYISTDTYRQAIESKLQIAFDSGDDATDELMSGIVESLNQYIMRLAQKQIQLAFEQSEKEVTDLQQRTKEGLVTAKENGKRIGTQPGDKLTTKKSIAAKAVIVKHNKTFGGQLNNDETIKQAGISRMTFYKYKSELLSEAQ